MTEPRAPEVPTQGQVALSEELLSCPFCGRAPSRFVTSRGDCTVTCEQCNINTHDDGLSGRAAALWNRRVDSAKQPEIDRLTERLRESRDRWMIEPCATVPAGVTWKHQAMQNLAHIIELDAQIATLTSTNKQLIDELKHLRSQAGADSCADLVIRNKRLSDALEKYGLHGGECGWWFCGVCNWRVDSLRSRHAKVNYGEHVIARGVCTCGLTAALSNITEEKSND